MKIRITHGTKRKEQRKQKNEHPKQALKRRNQSTSTKITIREEKKIRKEQKTNDEQKSRSDKKKKIRKEQKTNDEKPSNNISGSPQLSMHGTR